jgi:hypothetical protein
VYILYLPKRRLAAVETAAAAAVDVRKIDDF